MTAWAQDQKVVGSIINFVADPRAEATMALGLAINEPPEKFGYYPRTKRFAMILKDGVPFFFENFDVPSNFQFNFHRAAPPQLFPRVVVSCAD